MNSLGSLHRRGSVSLNLTALDECTVAAVDSLGTVRVIEVGLTSILRYSQ